MCVGKGMEGDIKERDLNDVRNDFTEVMDNYYVLLNL